MPNVQGVEKRALGIREEGEACCEVIAQAPGDFRGVDADRVEFDALAGDRLVVAFELNQLGTAERSPIAAIEDIEGGFAGAA